MRQAALRKAVTYHIKYRLFRRITHGILAIRHFIHSFIHFIFCYGRSEHFPTVDVLHEVTN
jgi:hypothetical protein